VNEDEAWIAPMATALQLASCIYMVGALFQGIAYQPVMLMIIGLQIGLHSYCRRIDSARSKEALEQRKNGAAMRGRAVRGKMTSPSPSGDAVTA